MTFYKVDVELKLKNVEVESDEAEKIASIILSKTQIYYDGKGFDFYIAVSNICYKLGLATLYAASKLCDFNENLLYEYLSEINLEISKYIKREITLSAYKESLILSQECGYILNNNSINKHLGIEKLKSGYKSLITFEQIIKSNHTKVEALRGLENNLCSDNFKEEIERIYLGSQSPNVKGHPVHYIITYDDKNSEEMMLEYLIDALQSNNRVLSRRYAVRIIRGHIEFSDYSLTPLYESAVGGTIVVKLIIDDETDSKYFNCAAFGIISIINLMKKYRNKVLTVFSFENKLEKCRNLINENLDDITVINLSQGNAMNSKAKAYLKHKAENYNIKSDRELLSKIKKDTAYSATDLNEILDTWYDRILKEKIYSQYKKFETANKNTLNKKVSGWAIKELDSMIGLSKAKDTIYDALDFYKAQKIFKGKGFITDRPAMHMVFTGNPGTAKTTVARLFAQIMKDNDLLSVGSLYEVGRSNLVDKYVGWTAKNVKNKFKEARGSVLFIDEAYSLVDDKNGMYGDEAINTIVQEMENNRDNMIVIFAGYPKEMEKFLEKNPGLKSRIAFYVPFDDYNANELFEITNFIANKNRITLDKDVNKKLVPIFEKAVNIENFGNGRFVRNMFEKAIMKQSSRLIAMDFDEVTKSDVTTLVAEDFEIPTGLSDKCKRKIGF